MGRTPLSVSALLCVLALLGSASAGLAERVGREPSVPTFDQGIRTVAMGVSIHDGRRLADLDAHRKAIGRAPATWSIWSQWGDPATSSFPTKVARGARDRGSTPLIFWEPVDPADLSSPRYARHANIIAGNHDTYIRRFARDAKDFRGPVILRLAHEGNGRSFPWGMGSFDNTPASFVAAWQHVHDIFRSVGARNVRFLWSVSKQSCSGGCNPYTEFYPGDAYVDYLGFSTFNWGASRDEWVPMVDGARRVTNHLSAISSKPILVAEVGCSPDGGDKAAWIGEGYPAVYAELPAIVGIIYLDVDLRSLGHPDWRLVSPPGALDAYKVIAARAEFKGKLPA